MQMVLCNEYHENPFVGDTDCDFLKYCASLIAEILSNFSSKSEDLFDTHVKVVNGHQGREVRDVTPNCIIFLIWDLFADPDDAYIGHKYATNDK